MFLHLADVCSPVIKRCMIYFNLNLKLRGDHKKKCEDAFQHLKSRRVSRSRLILVQGASIDM